MPRLQPFHERGFALACSVVRLYVLLIKSPDMPWHIAQQVLKSGTSVGANLEEARGAQTRRDLATKFSIALKEGLETQYWLRLILATHLAPPELISSTLDDVGELIAILTVTRRRLNQGG